MKPERLLLPPWADGGVVWLKAGLRPPFLEHLSFRFGNQLFFIRIEDTEGVLEVPGSRQGLERIAQGCKGHACLMPMQKKKGKWAPAVPDWGLVTLPTPHFAARLSDHGYGVPVFGVHQSADGKSHGFVDGRDVVWEPGQPINPPRLVTDEKIETTDWEIQDFAVQIVRDSLPREKVMSWNSDPDVSPSLWFVGPDGPEWVIVKVARYPETDAPLPDNLDEIAENCARLSRKGNFAVVAFTNTDGSDPFEPHEGPIGALLPLYRGHPAYFQYDGLKKIKG
ncbi:hypothetical protein FACS1894205_4070 [Alphaproteobacteria bacterium]|nr:hypothetical protein FACS1894205_4070 [Alphaproteobacteria bacterium]